jgi:hypothetical protein
MNAGKHIQAKQKFYMLLETQPFVKAVRVLLYASSVIIHSEHRG